MHPCGRRLSCRIPISIPVAVAAIDCSSAAGSHLFSAGLPLCSLLALLWEGLPGAAARLGRLGGWDACLLCARLGFLLQQL